MANNRVSEWLRQDLYTPDSGDEALASYYATKLDRLVEAAERYSKTSPMRHMIYCSTSTSEVCSCGANAIATELAAALAAIKLPKERL